MLRALFPTRTEERAQASTWGSWPGEVTPTWSGESVTQTSAMQLLAVYGCVRRISDGISTLPVDTFRKLPSKRREQIAAPAWLVNPTMDLTFTEWCSQVLVSLLLDGNAYVAIMRNESGAIVELIPINPEAVEVRRVAGRKVYMINGQPSPVDIGHIKGLMMPGSEIGLSPIEAARQAIGLGLASTRYGAEYFAGDGNMPGVIEIPKPAQPNTMKELAEQWRRKRSKGGRGLPGVLQDGATWKPTGVTNEQAQFLATRQFTDAQIAGQMFLLDPSEIGVGVSGTSLTYANLEQRNSRTIQVGMLPYMVRIEAFISALLFNPRYMKFNVNGLLRGDMKSRYEAYAIGIQNQFLDPSEPRDWEDLEEMPSASADSAPMGDPNA